MVPMSDAIEAMRWAFTQLSNGNVLLPTRSSMDIPDKNAKGDTYKKFKQESIAKQNLYNSARNISRLYPGLGHLKLGQV